VYRRIPALIIPVLLGWFACTERQEPPVHPSGWYEPETGGLHVEKVTSAGIASCTSCHGRNYTGGTSGVSCYSCHTGGASGHPSLVAWINPDSAAYHGRIFWENGWDFSACQSCHGEDFTGGVAETSCLACHTEGIGSCTTCHGDRDAGHSYPPKSIMNQSSPELVGVGAHQAHLESDLAEVACRECHVVPESYLDPDHLGLDNIAEVTFDTLATGGGELTPVWDREAATCSAVYCHGNFAFAKDSSAFSGAYTADFIVGNDTTFVWTAGVDPGCDACHGYPPAGHLTSTACGACHNTVVGSDNVTIIDKTKHINGEKNYP
jgi:predicted CxxxxCH...CXXCH cytochrome family protein